MKYASVFQRLVAWFLESSLQWFVVLILLSIGMSQVVNLADFTSLGIGIFVLIIWIPTVYILYQAYLTSLIGGGIGKILVGIAVVDQEEHNLTFFKAFFRTTVGYLVSNLVFGLGYIWIFKSAEKQAWHDMLAGSFVVNRGGNIARTMLVALFATVILVLNGYFLVNAWTTLSKNQLMVKEVGNVLDDLDKSLKTTEKDSAPAPELP